MFLDFWGLVVSEKGDYNHRDTGKTWRAAVPSAIAAVQSSASLHRDGRTVRPHPGQPYSGQTSRNQLRSRNMSMPRPKREKRLPKRVDNKHDSNETLACNRPSAINRTRATGDKGSAEATKEWAERKRVRNRCEGTDAGREQSERRIQISAKSLGISIKQASHSREKR